MKKTFIRKIAALLCVLTVCALFPLTTGAYSDAFTTVTYLKDKKEYSRLYMPAKGNFYTSKDKLPRRAEVKASWKNGCIYFMPRAELGHGTLGVVDTGTPVTILARQNGLYFFMTDDGRMGWNGPVFFTKPKKISEDLSEPLSEDSVLTGEHIREVSKFLSKNRNAGVYSWMFYADQPVVVVKSGETVELDVHSYFCKLKYKCTCTDGTSADVDWDGKFYRNSSTVEFTGREPGVSVFKFTTSRYKAAFKVMVIVV